MAHRFLLPLAALVLLGAHQLSAQSRLPESLLPEIGGLDSLGSAAMGMTLPLLNCPMPVMRPIPTQIPRPDSTTSSHKTPDRKTLSFLGPYGCVNTLDRALPQLGR